MVPPPFFAAALIYDHEVGSVCRALLPKTGESAQYLAGRWDRIPDPVEWMVAGHIYTVRHHYTYSVKDYVTACRRSRSPALIFQIQRSVLLPSEDREQGLLEAAANVYPGIFKQAAARPPSDGRRMDEILLKAVKAQNSEAVGYITQRQVRPPDSSLSVTGMGIYIALLVSIWMEYADGVLVMFNLYRRQILAPFGPDLDLWFEDDDRAYLNARIIGIAEASTCQEALIKDLAYGIDAVYSPLGLYMLRQMAIHLAPDLLEILKAQYNSGLRL